MKIQKFKFINNRQNWHIEEVSFDSLNLLVGASGVGKTRILSAIALICDVANSINHKPADLNSQYLYDLEWSITFSQLRQEYRWEVKTASEKPEIVYEKLIQFKGNSEDVIFSRSDVSSTFNGDNLPKLKRTVSMINILSEETLIAPVSQAFKRCIFLNSNFNLSNIFNIIPDPETLPDLVSAGVVDAPTVIKALCLQEKYPNKFNELKKGYKDIFPDTEDLRVSSNRDSLGNFELFFEIQENSAWINQQSMSSGMFHTLIFLIEFTVAPEESVILIDEFENGLGINCMPQLAEFILDQPPDLQFILTSHHPYIIGHLPWQNWQIVSKSGSNIKVRRSTDIPALDTASSLDKFTQLINFLDYEESSK